MRRPKRHLSGALVFLIPSGLGFIMGIVPGLLLGLPGWHEVAAVLLPMIWAIGYLAQPGKHVTWISIFVAVLGGVGLGVSISVFGSITSG